MVFVTTNILAVHLTWVNVLICKIYFDDFFFFKTETNPHFFWKVEGSALGKCPRKPCLDKGLSKSQLVPKHTEDTTHSPGPATLTVFLFLEYVLPL